jgi:hypothetical protein
MAINPQLTGSTPANRPQAPATQVAESATTATPAPIVDSLEPGQARPTGVGQPAQDVPYQATEGGRIAGVVLEPGATRWFESARTELHEAHRGEHSWQESRERTLESRERYRMSSHERQYTEAEEAAQTQRAAANETYAAAQTRADNGFPEEHQRLDQAGVDLGRAQLEFDQQLGAQLRTDLEGYQELATRDGSRLDEPARERMQQLSGRLRDAGIDPSQFVAQAVEPGSPQERANTLVQAQAELEAASDFPRSEAATEAWLGEQLEQRNQSLASADSALTEASSQLAGQRQSVQGELQEWARGEETRLMTRLSDRLEREQDLSLRRLQPEIARARAVEAGGYDNVRLSDQGVQLVDRRAETPPAQITTGEDGTITVESRGDRLEASSVLTPEGEGYRESSEVRRYSTYGEERRLTSEEVTRRDANGDLEYRNYRTHDYRGGGREEFFERTEHGQTERTTLMGSDGEAYYERARTETDIEGTRTETDRTMDHNGTAVRTEIERPDGSSTSRYEYEGNSGYNSQRTTETDPDGVRTEFERTENVYSSGLRRSVERHTHDGRLVEETTREEIRPDTDVPGLGWIGSHNPQDLVERFEDDPNLTGERVTVRSRNEEGGFQTRETVTMRSGDGQRELIQSQGAHGGNAWEMRTRNDDGTWDSQIFLQGTNDTIVTTERREDGFVVSERTSSMEALNEQNPDVPARSQTTTRTAEAASTDQTLRAVEQSRIGAIRDTDSFRSFMEQSGDGPFQVLSTESTEGQGSGQESSASLILEAADGRRLVAAFNEERQTYLVQNYDAEGEITDMSALTQTPGGLERLEVNGDGQVATYRLQGGEFLTRDGQAQGSSGAAEGAGGAGLSTARAWVRTAEDVVTAPRQLSNLARALSRGGEAAATGSEANSRLGRILGNGVWAGRIGTGAGGLAASLSALTLAADLSAGDYERAGRTAGNLGVDIATISRAAQGDDFLRPAGAARAAGRWTARGARVLGVAGLVTGAAFAVYDASQGEYGRATLGAAGAGGAALALFGSASWAGPVGWGVAGVASLGMMAWDYSDSTRVADYQLDS